MPLTKLSRKYHLLKKDKYLQNVQSVDGTTDDIEPLKRSPNMGAQKLLKRQQNMVAIPETPSSSSENEQPEHIDKTNNIKSAVTLNPDSEKLIPNHDSEYSRILPAHLRELSETDSKITVRRKVRESRKCVPVEPNIQSRQNFESSGMSFTDCQHWHRFESTHIDHLLGLTHDDASILTEDFSRIMQTESVNENAFESSDNESYHSVEEEPIETNHFLGSDDHNNSESKLKILSNNRKTLESDVLGNNYKENVKPNTVISPNIQTRPELMIESNHQKIRDRKLEATECGDKFGSSVISQYPEKQSAFLGKKCVSPQRSELEGININLLKSTVPLDTLKTKRVAESSRNPRRSILGRNEVILLSSDSDSSSSDGRCSLSSKCCWKKHILKYPPIPKVLCKTDGKCCEKTQVGTNGKNDILSNNTPNNLLSVSRLENIEQWLQISPFMKHNQSSFTCPKERKVVSSDSECDKLLAQTPRYTFEQSMYSISDDDIVDNKEMSSQATSKQLMPLFNQSNLKHSFSYITRPEDRNTVSSQKKMACIKDQSTIINLRAPKSSHKNNKALPRYTNRTHFRNDIGHTNESESAQDRQSSQILANSIGDQTLPCHGEISNSSNHHTYELSDVIMKSHGDTKINHSKLDNTSCISNNQSGQYQEEKLCGNTILTSSLQSNPQKNKNHTSLSEDDNFYLKPFSSPSDENIANNSLQREDKGFQISFSEDSDECITAHSFQNSVGLQVSLDDSDSSIKRSQHQKKRRNKDIKQISPSTNSTIRKELYPSEKERDSIRVDVSYSNIGNELYSDKGLDTIEKTQDLLLHLSLDTESLIQKEPIKDSPPSCCNTSFQYKHNKTKNIFGNYLSLSESDSNDELLAAQDNCLARSSEVTPKSDVRHHPINCRDSKRVTTMHLHENTLDSSKYCYKETLGGNENDEKNYDSNRKLPKAKQLESQVTYTKPSSQSSSYMNNDIDWNNTDSKNTNTPRDHRISITQNTQEMMVADELAEVILKDNFVYQSPYPDHLTTINTTKSSNLDITYNSNVPSYPTKIVPESESKRSSSKVRGQMNLTDNQSLPQSPVISKPTLLLKICPLLECVQRSNDGDLSFLSSLSLSTPDKRCHPEALRFVKSYTRHKHDLVNILFHLFNVKAFESKLPPDMMIAWNARLTKTAGMCTQRRLKITKKPNLSFENLSNNEIEEVRASKIELSTKVLDSSDRLRDTLIHEMCHAAAWVISGYRNGHGPIWKCYAEKAMKAFPELPIIARCHSYAIRTKYQYRCAQCGYTIGRHSKSLDTASKCCGYCRGKFELIVNVNNGEDLNRPTGGNTNVNLQTPKRLNPFSEFVKDNYKLTRTPGISHADTMKQLSEKFAKSKITESS